MKVLDWHSFAEIAIVGHYASVFVLLIIAVFFGFDSASSCP
jgi:hypothetical protein